MTLGAGLQRLLTNHRRQNPLGGFLKRTTRSRRHLVDLAVGVIRCLAGGAEADVSALVQGVAGRLKTELCATGDKNHQKAMQVVKNVGVAIDKLPPNKHSTRQQLLSLVVGEFTRPQLLSQFGFKFIGQKGFKTARAARRTNGTITSPRQGRRPVSAALRSAIEQQWFAEAAPSPNKAGSYVLQQTKTSVALAIRARLGVSVTLAKRLKPRCIRTPRRSTDMCHNCTDYHVALRRLNAQVEKLEAKYELKFESAAAALEGELTALEAYAVATLSDAVATLQCHVDAKNRQNANLELAISDTTNGSVLNCVVDFQQDPQLGHGPLEVDDAWHNFGRAAVCGFAFYLPILWNMPAMAKAPIYVAVVSPTSDHTAFAAHRALEEALWLIRQEYPQEWAQVTRVEIWCDTGKHFRSFVFCGCVLGALPQAFPTVAFGWNSFVEHHGKGIVDVFFAMLTALLKEEWRRTRVSTAEELVEAYKKQGRRRAAEVDLLGGVPAVLHFHLCDLSGTTPKCDFRVVRFDSKVPVLSKTYCLRAKPGGGVVDCGFSDLQDGGDLGATFTFVPRGATSAAKLHLPAPAPAETNLTKLAAKFDALHMRTGGQVKRARLADTALETFAFDLSVVGEPALWARSLAKMKGMQVFYKDGKKGTGMAVGTIVAELTSDERARYGLPDESHVSLKQFSAFGPRVRIIAVEELVTNATAASPSVYFLRAVAGDRAPAYLDTSP